MSLGPLFTFAHVTDVHVTATSDCLRSFVTATNAAESHARPDFVAFTGDMTVSRQGDPAVLEQEWARVRQDLEALTVPYYLALGNHDVAFEDVPGTAFRQHYPEREFFFSVPLPGGYLGVFMAWTATENGKPVALGDKLDWLEQLLAEHSDRRVLLFSHQPPFPPRRPTLAARLHELRGPPWVGEEYPEDRCRRWQARFFGMSEEEGAPFRRRLARPGNLVAHYSGHSHVHAHLREDGVHYVNTAALVANPKEYRWVQVFPDRIEHRCIRMPEPWAAEWFYRGCTDENHLSEEIYHAGTADERDLLVQACWTGSG